MSREVKLLLFVGGIILLVVFILLIILKIKASNKHNLHKNKKNKRLDRKIRKFAKNNDFLFLNDVFLPIDNSHAIIIDNIIFGNKYIYVISQKHWEGELKGYEYDTKWMVTTKHSTKYVDNPINGNRFKVRILLNFLKEKDEDTVVNIIAISNKTKFNNIQLQPLENVINMNDLFKLIEDYEKNSPLNDIKEEELERIANLIYEQSIKISNSQKKEG